jgi:hypothetical protein
VISGHFLDGIRYKSPGFVLLLFSREFWASSRLNFNPERESFSEPFWQVQIQEIAAFPLTLQTLPEWKRL